MQFIDLAAQYQYLKQKIDSRVHQVLDHGKYIMGPEVYELEERLAEYVGVKHAISCANGTDALQLSLMVMGIGQNDAVIVPPFTFFASAEAIALMGATPVFSDIDPQTYNLCPKLLEETIVEYQQTGDKHLKAVLAVDLFGQPANYLEIEKICSKHGLLLIEDGAQGFGGEINGRKVGAFGDIATTSFFPAKPLGCYGDGGVVFTNNDEYAALSKSLRVHGKGSDKYDNVRVGMNSRLDTIQAAILLEKLSVFDDELVARQNVATRYSESLAKEFTTPFVARGYRSAWAQYSIVPKGSMVRSEIISKLNTAKIPNAIYYPQPLHLSTAFAYLDNKKGDFSQAEYFAESIFSLPMHPYLSIQEQNTVIEVVLESGTR